jgi:hypothetical protein
VIPGELDRIVASERSVKDVIPQVDDGKGMTCQVGTGPSSASTGPRPIGLVQRPRNLDERLNTSAMAAKPLRLDLAHRPHSSRA